MTSYPYWISLPTLSTRAEGYSFSDNPEVLYFGETSDLPCTVILLNGSLPPGVRWQASTSSVSLIGKISGVADSTNFEFTFRASNGTRVSDRTFFIQVLDFTDQLEWVTSNADPIGYLYTSGPNHYQITAESDPVKPINYAITNLALLPPSISIDSTGGTVTVDLSWRAGFAYQAYRDVVLNNGRLYTCVISGQSGLSTGPTPKSVDPQTGIVDTTYPIWLPGRLYFLNDTITNDVGKLYVCISGGISYLPGSGPAGTGQDIPDGPTAVWRYIGQAPVWDQIPDGTILPLTLLVTADTDTLSLPAQSFTISVLSRPYQPVWRTPAGLIETTYVNNIFEFSLDAFDPDGSTLTWASNDLPTWLNLSSQGQLWGTAPNLSSSVTQTFTVSISDGGPYVDRTFSIRIVRQTVDLQWITTSDLGQVKDGELCSIQFQAISTRSTLFISYGFSGGMLPPNALVVSDSGLLSGLIDYHPRSRDYLFEISASDGVDVIKRQFKITVAAQPRGIFLGLSIPLLGQDRLDFDSLNNESVVPTSSLFLIASPLFGRIQAPEIPVVSGIAYDTTQNARDIASWYLNEFRVQFEDIYATSIEDAPYQALWLQVQDANNLPAWAPGEVYNTGDRVSMGNGVQLVATQGGTSGDWPGPRLRTSGQTDGTVVWGLEAGANLSAPWSYPLPWYPYHFYTAGQRVENRGHVYEAVNTGQSGGDFGPTHQTGTQWDGSVQWQAVSNMLEVANREYPPSIFNLRRSLINSYGFSTAHGTGANAFATVDSFSGTLTGVTVTNQGRGYFDQPTINASGGSGAQFSCVLVIVSAAVLGSGPGFAVGEKFSVTQGEGTPGEIEVASVNNIGVVTSVNVVNVGAYSRFPTGVALFSKASRSLSIGFDIGVGSVSLLASGSGYDSTTQLDFLGRELLPFWQEQELGGYTPSVQLAALTSQGASAFNRSVTALNPYKGQAVEVKWVRLHVDGVQWQGTVTWDSNQMTFDGDATGFVDFDSALTSTFDERQTIFENNQTQFDQPPLYTPVFGQTVLDADQTLLDYYATLFDTRSVMTRSLYGREWLVPFGKPFT